MIRTITSPDPIEPRDRPDPSRPHQLAGRPIDRTARGATIRGRPATSWRRSARTRGTSTSGSGPRCSSTTIHRYRLQDSPDLPPGGVVPFDGFTDLMERRFEQAIAAFRAARSASTAPTARSPAPWPRLTSGSPTRPWPTRSAGRSGAAPGTAGCSGSARSTSTRSGSTPGCWSGPRGRPVPDPGRADAGPARPDPLGLVGHLLPGDGLPRGGEGPQHLGRPRRPRPRRPAHPADRDPGPGDLRAGPPPDQHRPQRLQGRGDPGGAVQLRQRLPRAGQGRGDRLGPGPGLARGDLGPAR